MMNLSKQLLLIELESNFAVHFLRDQGVKNDVMVIFHKKIVFFLVTLINYTVQHHMLKSAVIFPDNERHILY